MYNILKVIKSLSGLSAVTLCLSVASSFAGNGSGWLDPEKMLGGIAMVESSGGKFLVGDGGKSLGVHQISRDAWTDVNRARAKAGLGTYAYELYALNSPVNRAYARDYITILQVRLARAMGRTPSVEQVYAAFNMGFERFSELNFDLSRANKITQRNSYAVRTSYDRSIASLAALHNTSRQIASVD